MPGDEGRLSEEERERIRGWYEQARELGISDLDFFREMSPILGEEAIEEALEMRSPRQGHPGNTGSA